MTKMRRDTAMQRPKHLLYFSRPMPVSADQACRPRR